MSHVTHKYENFINIGQFNIIYWVSLKIRYILKKNNTLFMYVSYFIILVFTFVTELFCKIDLEFNSSCCLFVWARIQTILYTNMQKSLTLWKLTWYKVLKINEIIGKLSAILVDKIRHEKKSRVLRVGTVRGMSCRQFAISSLWKWLPF